jgi:putative membrane protein
MTHLKSTLPRLSAVAVTLAWVAGVAACSNNASPANAPNAPRTAPTFSAYGPALGEGAGYSAGPSTEATPGEVGRMPPPMPQPVAIGPKVVATGNPPVAASSVPAPVTWGVGSESAAMGVTNQMGGATDVSSLNDAQFAAVVQAINQSEIQEAQLAMSKATSADTKRFARDMATGHRTMETKLDALFAHLQITPSDNAISNQIKSDAQTEMQALQAMRGKDFDRDYIDTQVTNHNKALELLDRITPNVKSSELRTALTNARTGVETHLREAERIQQSLQKGTANTQPGASSAAENTP